MSIRDTSFNPSSVQFKDMKGTTPIETTVRVFGVCPGMVSLQIRGHKSLVAGGSKRNLYAHADLNAEQVTGLIALLATARDYLTEGK